jgi:hypothetical protein
MRMKRGLDIASRFNINTDGDETTTTDGRDRISI